jgi:hypothetical protein
MKEKGKSRGAIVDKLKGKFAEFEHKRAELEAKFKALSGSSSPTVASGEWKGRFCRGEGFPGTGTSTRAGGMSVEVRDRVCGHWNKASTTPKMKDLKASSTPMVKVLAPNGGVRFIDKKGAVIISWRNTTKDKTVDIDLTSGSTTTSIAKDVVGKRGGENNRGRGSNKGKGKDMAQRTYRWVGATEGEGYKLVITAKDGETTYTDESDTAFALKKFSKTMHSNSDSEENVGAVLGATTSAADEAQRALTALEADLVLMLAQMSS